MCKHGPKKYTKSDLEKALGNALGKQGFKFKHLIFLEGESEAKFELNIHLI